MANGNEMVLVVIESPYAPTKEEVEELAATIAVGSKRYWIPEEMAYQNILKRNLEYLRAAMRDCLIRGESPYASHALYTQPGVLDDTMPKEREWGIQAGFAWRSAAERTVVYTDLGISKGMEYGINHAKEKHTPIEFRELGSSWKDLLNERTKSQTWG